MNRDLISLAIIIPPCANDWKKFLASRRYCNGLCLLWGGYSWWFMNKKLRRDCLVQFREAVKFLPTSSVLSFKIWLNISTIHLVLSRMIHNSRFIAAIASCHLTSNNVFLFCKVLRQSYVRRWYPASKYQRTQSSFKDLASDNALHTKWKTLTQKGPVDRCFLFDTVRHIGRHLNHDHGICDRKNMPAVQNRGQLWRQLMSKAFGNSYFSLCLSQKQPPWAEPYNLLLWGYWALSVLSPPSLVRWFQFRFFSRFLLILAVVISDIRHGCHPVVCHNVLVYVHFFI